MKVAIIGAGLAGLTLARQLSGGHAVTVFEKARGPGGRMSTRRATPFGFDHGAQYFTAETDLFRSFLAPFEGSGTVSAWPETIQLVGDAKVSSKAKFAAVPGMNGICKALASDLNLRVASKVEALERGASGWTLQTASGEGYGPFDWVVSTAPAPQTEVLFPDSFKGMQELENVEMLGCFALMLGFDTPMNLPWSALKSGIDPIGWMAINSSKPGRDQAYSMLIQSSNSWAERHLEDDLETIKSTLLQSASDLADIDLSSAPHQVLHRWRYAATARPAGQPYLMDRDLQIAACGDWCLGSKVESAFLSASALAEAF